MKTGERNPGSISLKVKPPSERSLMMAEFELQVNGELKAVDVDPDMPLLWVLREVLGLTGTKYSCGEGVCGACTVHLNGEAVPSCILPVSKAVEYEITTIEGLAEDSDHPLLQAWIANNVPQCGYCQPGQIMAAAALLNRNPKPSPEEIRQAMSGNLCRCGTYQRIQTAIQDAAGQGGEA
jgi:aerobic-type carbon monoxide dehydrogenase small subunit (CoxS/CutS family)